MLNDSSIRTAIDRFVEKNLELSTKSKVHDFLMNCSWDIHADDAVHLEKATSFLPHVHFINFYDATALASLVAELEGGTELADKLIDAWISGFAADNSATAQMPSDFHFRHIRGGEVHPRIQLEIDKLVARVQSTATLFEVLQTLNNQNGWGEREVIFLRGVTSESFEAAMLAAGPYELRLLLIKGIDLLVNNRLYGESFGETGQRFLGACLSIVNHNRNPKLSRLIRSHFQAHAPNRLLEGDHDAMK